MIIVLETDFGADGYYAAQMKGVILRIAPEAKIIDLTHQIEPQNIKQASFLLKNAYNYFPDNSIFICVVDPGVGSERRAIALKAKNRYFIGPDNGIFNFLWIDNNNIEAIHLNRKEYFFNDISNTFHGRDIFAPVAAHLASGVKFLDFGEPISTSELIKLPEIISHIEEDGSLTGEIIFIDGFGNLITSISSERIESTFGNKEFKIIYRVETISGFFQNYFDALNGKPFAYIGSSNHLEIAVKNGNAAQYLNGNTGDLIRISELE
ncbi:MAG: hypothetical protein HW421_2186 [Ignavibacteria bacterium]|nr:hypothetical protein [Ignavibacteria bacterium]